MLIGLVGEKHHGKSLAAQFLAQYYGFQRHRFAGPLKAMLKTLGLTDEEIDGAKKHVPCALLGGQTPVWAMQSLGTEWGRKLVHPDLWVLAWALTLPAGDVVSDDTRFANEAKAIRARGGRLYRIRRPAVHPGAFSNHASEIEQRNLVVDGEVMNPAPLVGTDPTVPAGERYALEFYANLLLALGLRPVMGDGV